MSARKDKVTREVYNKIKKYIKDHGYVAKDDKIVMKAFGYGKTVVRDIRNTKDYDEYIARRYRFGGYPRKKGQRTLRQAEAAAAANRPAPQPVERYAYYVTSSAAEKAEDTSENGEPGSALESLIEELEGLGFEAVVCSRVSGAYKCIDSLQRKVNILAMLCIILTVLATITWTLIITEMIK